jgi:hypothetical protein
MSKIEKKLKKAVKRINKSKGEIVEDIKRKEKIEHMKWVVRTLYPLIERQDTIYDAQTVVNALSGFITAHIEKKVLDIKMNQLEIDLSGEEVSKIKSSIENIITLMRNESAQELSETLERLGQALSQYSANKFMKQPMSTIKLEDILA